MADGVLVFEGMRVGVLPGDLKIEADEAGNLKSTLILSTSYNVLPLWLRIASDQLREAKIASDAVANRWSPSDEANRELLVAELEPSLQIFLACGIALDALYDQVRPFARLSPSEIQAWKSNRTARAKQIADVFRRVYRLDAHHTAEFRKNLSEIFTFRDKAVHPSLELKQSCTRPDVPVGVDWKFSAYRYSNAVACFRNTMTMIIYLYERTSGIEDVDAQMNDVIRALEQLGVVERRAAI
jgi:hypothetical protein